MIGLTLVATRDRDLYEQVQRELLVPASDDPLCKSVDPRFRTVAEIRRRANAAELIIIHASTPADDKSTDGESGKAVLQLLHELRQAKSTTRTVILLPHRMEDIESFCAK